MDPVEEIKDRLGVDEVVGGYVQLKPAGSNLKGLCPFHNEKTPSFTVSPDKGIYHCFGCGEGGDIFSFVEKMEGLDFRGALEQLAQRAGVELPQGKGDGKSARAHKQRLSEVLKTTTQYYHIQLKRNPEVLEYVTDKRQINQDTIKKFRLGYAPGGGGRLKQFLMKHGFKEKELLDAGVVRQKEGGLQDIFRQRVMVPFIDPSGKVIGFTGRAIGEGLPKYLNTPQTPLFDKSRFVFGLHEAKDSIRTSNEAVVVEGNIDVLTSHQAGITNVVAVSGTALTLHQLKQLGRLAKNITLAFDADQAGLNATKRALPLAQEAKVSLSIVSLPTGSDPDDLIRSDPKQWQEVLNNKVYVVDWLFEVLQNTFDIKTAQGKKLFTDEVSEVLHRLTDPVEQEHYVQKLAGTVNVSPGAISQKIKQHKTKPTKPLKKATAPKQPPLAHDEVETVATALLSIAATYPDVRNALEELDSTSLPEAMQTVAGFLLENETVIDIDKPPKQLQSDINYVKILLLRGEEEYGSWATLDRQVEAFSLVHRLNKLQTKRYKQHLSQRITTAEADGDYELRQKLLKEFNQL